MRILVFFYCLAFASASFGCEKCLEEFRLQGHIVEASLRDRDIGRENYAYIQYLLGCENTLLQCAAIVERNHQLAN